MSSSGKAVIGVVTFTIAIVVLNLGGKVTNETLPFAMFMGTLITVVGLYKIYSDKGER